MSDSVVLTFKFDKLEHYTVADYREGIKVMVQKIYFQFRWKIERFGVS